MMSTLYPGHPAGHQQNWQVLEEVQIAIAQRAAIKDHGVIQKASIAVGRRLQPLQIIGQHAHVEEIYLDDLIDLLDIPQMVSQRMV